ncbi:glyoxylase-like metal-dependent hydrolase (beta-lactamase superfamily II) [Streptomyces sp. SAI-170]
MTDPAADHGRAPAADLTRTPAGAPAADPTPAAAPAKGPARIEHLVTKGTFTLDGDTFDVENNVWLIGDDQAVLVVDAAHDARTIAEAVAGRRVTAIVCTHAHDDHIGAAHELSVLTGAPVLLHPDDTELWSLTHPARKPDGELTDGRVLTVAGTALHVVHTPGHTWGSCCLYAPAPESRIHRRHPLPRRPRRHRPLLLRPPDHRGVDPRPAAHPARRHGRPHRARPGHHDRRGAVPPAQPLSA